MRSEGDNVGPGRAARSGARRLRWGWAGLLAAAVAMGMASSIGVASQVVADFGVHDPSRVVGCKDRYWLFMTGAGCRSAWSRDLTNWVEGPRVFPQGLPVWAATAAPGNNGDVWAPDVIQLNGRYLLYYCVSVFGRNTSGIGLATNPTLDPADPAYRWTDEGLVLQTVATNDFNALDPCPVLGVPGGLWLGFGSYWSGIKLTRLDPGTGKRITPDSTLHALAWNPSIEACYLHPRAGWYYLFVNWGSCCQGVTSTYNIRVGRSRAIVGPYVDQAGVPLLEGGGSLVRATNGRFVGPGHAGIFENAGTDWMSVHYYDANRNGAPRLDLRSLTWTPSGWPQVDESWEAHYPFRRDLRDEHDDAVGVGSGGAWVGVDAQRGHVLSLSGVNQYVTLPGGVANGRTFAAWVRWTGDTAWQRVFDFGVDQTRYLYVTPANGLNSRLRFVITTTGPAGEQVIDGAGPLPFDTWTHLAVTLDGQSGVLYVDGLPHATNTAMNLAPSDVFATRSYLGKSQWPDPLFRGAIDSFRVFSNTLDAAEVRALTRTTPPEPSIAWTGSQVVIAWPAEPTDFSVEASASLDADALWVPSSSRPTVSDGWNRIAMAPTPGKRFFRFGW